MNQLKKRWQKLSAKKQVCIHLLIIFLLLFLIYSFLGCPPLSAKGGFRRAEKASMVGPATILGQVHPDGYPCDAIVLGKDPEGVYLYVMDRWRPEASELVYRKKQGSLTLLAVPGDTLYQYEVHAQIPVFLFDDYADAVRAEVDLTLRTESFEKTYPLEASRESEGFFRFDLVARNAGSLGEEGNALRLLQEISSNSMAGNPDIAFPAAVRLYDASGNPVLEETTHIRSAAAQVQPQWPCYTGTMEGYVYRHTEDRARKWEEDILYLAQTCLDTHPYVTGEPVWTFTYSKPFGGKTSGFSNEIYREETRLAFIHLVNDVIAQIPEYTDAQMVYEAQRIVRVLGDIHSSLTVGTQDDAVFPIRYEHIVEDGAVSLYAVQVSPEYEDFYLGRLIAINNIPAEEIIEKLTPYIPAENEYYPIRAIASGSLSAKNALHAVGVMNLEDSQAEFTFETENGIITRSVTTVSKNEFQQLDMIRHPMITDAAIMRHQSGNYWYEILNGDTLYMRISSLSEEPNCSFFKYLTDAGNVLSESEIPMKLIIDFRSNHGGPEYLDQWSRFVESVQNCETDGIYLLINENCVSSGVAAPYQLRKSLENAQLVGTPTAQFPNSPAAQYEYTLPNNGNTFYISGDYFIFAPGEQDTALRPDVLVCQTWEDYQNNIGTVLDYVLSLPATE